MVSWLTPLLSGCTSSVDETMHGSRSLPSLSPPPAAFLSSVFHNSPCFFPLKASVKHSAPRTFHFLTSTEALFDFPLSSPSLFTLSHSKAHANIPTTFPFCNPNGPHEDLQLPCLSVCVLTHSVLFTDISLVNIYQLHSMNSVNIC